MEESPSLVSWPLLITADLKLNQKVKMHVQRSTSWSGLWSLLISWHQTGSWARCTGSRIGMPSGSEQHLSFEYHFLQILKKLKAYFKKRTWPVLRRISHKMQSEQGHREAGGEDYSDTISIVPRKIEEEMYPQKIYLLLNMKINNS